MNQFFKWSAAVVLLSALFYSSKGASLYMTAEDVALTRGGQTQCEQKDYKDADACMTGSPVSGCPFTDSASSCNASTCQSDCSIFLGHDFSGTEKSGNGTIYYLACYIPEIGSTSKIRMCNLGTDCKCDGMEISEVPCPRNREVFNPC